MRTFPRFVRVLPLLLLALLPVGVAAQSAADVMADFRAEYERRMAGVDDYTVVQNVMGTTTTVHFERQEVGGQVVFRPTAEVGGTEIPDQASPVDDGFFLRPDVADRMTYEGRDEVDGHACHVVRLTDFEGLGDVADQEEMEMESMSFCMDADEHVVRRMEMEGMANMGGGAQSMSTTAIFKDYREVGGMIHPWRVEMTVAGVGADPEQQARMREAMAEMEKQLEQLPESQRERVRSMMESRMEGMEGMMGIAGGEPMVIETVDVKVNEGPPAGR